ncbi:MAG: hypothetical protein R2939_08410 [Kofleriaceae bacterium]
MPTTPDDILAFWFAAPARWFAAEPAFDEEIRARFAACHVATVGGHHESLARHRPRRPRL